MRIENDIRVPMRDGVTLSVDIYRPTSRGASCDPDQDAVQQQHRAGRRAGQMVRRARLRCRAGDVRGKFDSAGDFYPFKNEPDDGFDTDEWIAKQPWFDGKLGTMGGSYVGFTQWSSGHSRQPLSDGDGRDRRHRIRATGSTPTARSTTRSRCRGEPCRSTAASRSSPAPTTGRVYRTLPIADAPASAGHRAPHYRDWIAHPTRDTHWNTLSHEDKHETIGVPIHRRGLACDIFLRGALQDHNAVRAKGKTENARRGKRLVIGPWVHSTGRRNNTPAGQAADPNAVDFGAAAESICSACICAGSITG